jgi:hypothetical protein
MLVFWTADVRLAPTDSPASPEAFAVHGADVGSAVHVTHKGYEQFSLIFNLIQIAPTRRPAKASTLLIGPSLRSLARSDYATIGGHDA